MKTGKCLLLGGWMVTFGAIVVGCGTALTGNNTDAVARLASAQQGGMGFLGDPLNLTDDQKAQAKVIFDSLRTDTQPLFEQAKTDIRNVLTADQQTKFDAMEANRPQPPFGGGDAGPQDGMQSGFAGPMGGGPGGMMGMPPPPFGGPMAASGSESETTERQARLDELAIALGLTDAQKAQIQTIQDNLHTAVEARRQQAMDAFRAILTADQIAILDQMKAMHTQSE